MLDTKKSATKAATSKEAKKPIEDAKSTATEISKKEAGPREATRRDSKQNMLIMLLKRPTGATVEEMTKATGWQSHSILGAISGVLKKRLGMSINSIKEERGRVYRIA